jgi:2-polyprenyl-3-methyl-5-hydroxy-6-metoxy-1,4-benzoquinol methylase
VQLIGEPHKDVEYLISSTCHADVFDHLESYNVKLWHVFDNTEDGKRLLPAGEWAITGGCDVGLRALTIAGFLGFRDLHVFGLDGSAREGKRHASTHPTNLTKYAECEYNGKAYHTTPGMLEAARQVWHELDQMPAVKATFYGDGLVQAMAKDYKPKEGKELLTNTVAFSKPELISAEYRDLNAKLHKENLYYGVGGGKHADTVKKLAESLKTTSVLDYGCGKGYLAKSLDFPIWEFDPAIPEKSETPRPADIVACTDVLEHVEPERIDYVLDDLRRVTKQVGFYVIHTGPSGKTLADGRNAHLLQRDRAWWEAALSKYFTVGKIIEQGPLLYAVVAPKVERVAA